MNFIDIILILLLVYGLFRGLMKGLVHELASLLSIVLGLFLAYKYADDVYFFLADRFNEEGAWLKVISYVLIFASVSISLYILAYFITKMLKFLALGLLNRFLGGIFGLVKVLILLLLLIYLIQPLFSLQEIQALKDSAVYPELLALSQDLGKYITEIPREEKADFMMPSVQDSLDTGQFLPF